jgi:hypothetical protein
MTTTSPSPVLLSYIGALRGVAPRKPGEAFAYAQVRCTDPWLFMCLAASNPEGRFYALIQDAAACAAAETQARAHRVENVHYLCATPRDVLERKVSLSLPPLNYLCADETAAPFSESERQDLFKLAEEYLQPNGLLHYGYPVAAKSDDTLRFLVQEFAPEMDGTQANGFLQELKALGAGFFAQNAVEKTSLETAIAKSLPDEFFMSYESGEAKSASFDTLVALRPRGFMYAGDSRIPTNYIELSVTPDADTIIASCRDNPLYEPIKDFALNRMTRSDVWCRGPITQSADPAELFGGFSYGITMPRDLVPTEVKAPGKTVDLSSPLFKKLIDLMAMMPISVGDFLVHADGNDCAPTDVVASIQILVACGVAQPMRGLPVTEKITNMAQPRLSGAFNKALAQAEISGDDVCMASPVLGDVMTVSARDAMVMQALDRAGLANSVSALLPELEKLAKNPAGAARVMDVATPTPESAKAMIETSVEQSMIRWYAYGLLEAA